MKGSWDYVESVDQFGESCQLNNSKCSNPGIRGLTNDILLESCPLQLDFQICLYRVVQTTLAISLNFPCFDCYFTQVVCAFLCFLKTNKQKTARNFSFFKPFTKNQLFILFISSYCFLVPQPHYASSSLILPFCFLSVYTLPPAF